MLHITALKPVEGGGDKSPRPAVLTLRVVLVHGIVILEARSSDVFPLLPRSPNM